MPRKFDPGPSAEWENLFNVAPLNHYINHATHRFRTEFCPVFYRGRLNRSIKVMVVGQDPSTDEILSQRCLVGNSGQKIQRLLNKIGIKKSYVMVNAFLFGIHGQFNAELRAISLEPQILNYRNQIFNKIESDNNLEIVLTFGVGARHAVENWPVFTALNVVNLVHPSATDNTVIQNWNAQLNSIISLVTPDSGIVVDSTPYSIPFQPSDNVDIPRIDLPFKIPDWHGTKGTRSHRNGNNEIVWTKP